MNDISLDIVLHILQYADIPVCWDALDVKRGLLAATKRLMVDKVKYFISKLTVREPLDEAFVAIEKLSNKWLRKDVHEQIGQLLLDAGADLASLDVPIFAQLKYAIMYNRSLRTKHLITTCNIDVNQTFYVAEHESTYIPLHVAVLSPDTTTLETLFTHAPDIDASIRNPSGYTALHLAVINNNEKACAILVNHTDINAVETHFYETALMKAAARGFVNIVKLILAKPTTNLSIRNVHGKTALDLALHHSQSAEMVALLSPS